MHESLIISPTLSYFIKHRLHLPKQKAIISDIVVVVSRTYCAVHTTCGSVDCLGSGLTGQCTHIVRIEVDDTVTFKSAIELIVIDSDGLDDVLVMTSTVEQYILWKSACAADILWMSACAVDLGLTVC